MKRRQRLAGQVGDQVDPVGRDPRLGSRNLASSLTVFLLAVARENRFYDRLWPAGRRSSTAPRSSPRPSRKSSRRPGPQDDRHRPRATARRGSAASRRSSPRAISGSARCGRRARRSTCAAIPASPCTAPPRTRRSGRATPRSPVAPRRSTTSASERSTRPAAPRPRARFHLFRADIDEAIVVALNDARDKLVIEHWHAGRGVRRVER